MVATTQTDNLGNNVGTQTEDDTLGTASPSTENELEDLIDELENTLNATLESRPAEQDFTVVETPATST